jgi:hypothetical protein
MIAIHLPSFATETEALDWLQRQGEVVRVVLTRGPDGLIRGNALVRREDAAS